MPDFDSVNAAYQNLSNQLQSLILATVNADGSPQISYAPYVMDEIHQIYIFASGLAGHTANLLRGGEVSVLLIADEAQSAQIFARQRLTYQCTVQPVPRDSALWSRVSDRFLDRFGDIIETLLSLGDFQIFQLSPRGGRFVMGFGAAYEVDPNRLSQLKPGPVRG
ncbi:MAG: pyridoxamine 5'-phosphate oxidase family protein [Cyanobacteria bacterium REEB459]|nr:pyridoxamine 5'-phosphate oxidase family protein [Cyanobacteria bacterium REEB459]